MVNKSERINTINSLKIIEHDKNKPKIIKEEKVSSNKLLKNQLKNETNKKNDELILNLKKLEEENKLLKNKLKDE